MTDILHYRKFVHNLKLFFGIVAQTGLMETIIILF